MSIWVQTGSKQKRAGQKNGPTSQVWIRMADNAELIYSTGGLWQFDQSESNAVNINEGTSLAHKASGNKRSCPPEKQPVVGKNLDEAIIAVNVVGHDRKCASDIFFHPH